MNFYIKTLFQVVPQGLEERTQSVIEELSWSDSATQAIRFKFAALNSTANFEFPLGSEK